MAKKTNLNAADVRNYLKISFEKKKPWIKAARKDFEYRLGKQWDDEDVETLRAKGVKAITRPKLSPHIQVCSGIQRQNRSDFMAYPVGDEDEVKSDVSTRLLKFLMSQCEGEYKFSEMFDDGITGGEGLIEAYIDYSDDLLNGKLKFEKLNPFTTFVDPSAKEYDLSDAKFIIKVKLGLCKEQLYTLFPKKKNDIDKITDGSLNIDGENITETGSVTTVQKGNAGLSNNPKETEKITKSSDTESEEEYYDLVEYYYRKFVTKYFVIDKKLSAIKEVKSKEDADKYVEQMRQLDTKTEIDRRVSEAQKHIVGIPLPMFQSTIDGIVAEVTANPPEDSAVVIERQIPEIWIASTIGNSEFFDDSRCWCCPKWKSYPIFRFLAFYVSIPMTNRELQIQGLIRDYICPQDEINKRTTQEIRILNSSANSGWKSPKDAWINPDMVRQFGSSPGVNLEYDPSKGVPERIVPTQLSQGHVQLTIQASQDIKEAHGLNTELLSAQSGGQSSGYAINLRMKQGLTMIQPLLDNFSQTKKIIGKFLLSQFGELFTVETAVKIVGDAYIKQQFSMPVMTQDPDPATGEMIQKPQADANGELVMEVDPNSVGTFFNNLLTDASVGKYDISLGEGIYSETTKYANYLMLNDLAKSGVPIPPEVLIEESTLAPGSKEKIKKAIAARAASQSQPPSAK
jgi:hypothetical protein